MSETEKIICIGTFTGGGDTTNGFPLGDTIVCNGTFIKITNNKKYESMEYGDNITTTASITGIKYTPRMIWYNPDDENTDHHQNPTPIGNDDSITNWFIQYTQP